MDSNNLMVRLCTEGMLAEGYCRHEDAQDLYAQAWAASKDDLDACVTAHYWPVSEGALRTKFR